MNNITLAENTLGQRIKAQRIKMHMTQEWKRSEEEEKLVPQGIVKIK